MSADNHCTVLCSSTPCCPPLYLLRAADSTHLPTTHLQHICAVGTFVASYLIKHHPSRVKGCVLIDPVCLGMFMPNLVYSFLYRQPVWQGWSKPE